jgi:hypothetical protein
MFVFQMREVHALHLLRKSKKEEELKKKNGEKDIVVHEKCSITVQKIASLL